MSQDYKVLYDQKCVEFEEVNEQFVEYSQQSNEIINDLQQEIKELKRKNQLLSRQLADVKEKRKCFNSAVEREIQLTKKQREQFKKKFIDFEKKVIELQIINENLQSDLRATKTILYDYEERTQKTMEELALLQVQLQQTTESNQEQIARLRSQLKQTEDELFALRHVKHKSETEKLDEKNDNSFEENIRETRRNSILLQSTRKSNIFNETLSEIRNYISQLSTKRSQLRQKAQKMLQSC